MAIEISYDDGAGTVYPRAVAEITAYAKDHRDFAWRFWGKIWKDKAWKDAGGAALPSANWEEKIEDTPAETEDVPEVLDKNGDVITPATTKEVKAAVMRTPAFEETEIKKSGKSPEVIGYADLLMHKFKGGKKV